jgi:hypothetical protein
VNSGGPEEQAIPAYLALLCKLKKSVKTFDSTFLQLLCFFSSGYHITWGFQALLLKLEKILQQTS